MRWLRWPFKPVFHGMYRLERHSIGLAVAIIAAASVGGLVEIVPLFTIDETVEEAPDMRVYTPLEVAGRDIYMREGCYACHSQMIRTLRDDNAVLDARVVTRAIELGETREQLRASEAERLRLAAMVNRAA